MLFKIGIRKLEDRGTAMAVVVPAAWVRQNQLRKGDAISIFINGEGYLVLIPEAKQNAQRSR